jgi:hypothetical protein
MTRKDKFTKIWNTLSIIIAKYLFFAIISKSQEIKELGI